MQKSAKSVQNDAKINLNDFDFLSFFKISRYGNSQFSAIVLKNLGNFGSFWTLLNLKGVLRSILSDFNGKLAMWKMSLETLLFRRNSELVLVENEEIIELKCGSFDVQFER